MATSLDSLHEKGAIKMIDFIHLDVEGGEYDALLGSKSVINTYWPVIVFEQHCVHDKSLPNITSLLNDLDYKIYIIDELSGAKYDCRNFVAIPPRKHRLFQSLYADSNDLIPPESIQLYINNLPGSAQVL